MDNADNLTLANGAIAYMLVFVNVLRLIASANRSLDEIDPSLRGKKMLYLLTRFMEPSSYAGFTAVAGGIINAVHGGDVVASATSIVGGLFAFLLPEGTKVTNTPS